MFRQLILLLVLFVCSLLAENVQTFDRQDRDYRPLQFGKRDGYRPLQFGKREFRPLQFGKRSALGPSVSLDDLIFVPNL